MDENFIQVVEYLRTQIAPEVISGGARIIFIDSLNEIIYSVLFFALSSYLLYRMVKFWLFCLSGKAKEGTLAHHLHEDDDELFLLLPIALLIAGVIVSGLSLLNVWMWIGLFNPELGFLRYVYDVAFS